MLILFEFFGFSGIKEIRWVLWGVQSSTCRWRSHSTNWFSVWWDFKSHNQTNHYSGGTPCCFIKIMMSSSISFQEHIFHGNLDETVYMHQPSNFRNPQHRDFVCLLRKLLNELKQGPCAWYQRFIDYVATLGFSHNIFNHSLFIYY